MREDFEVIEQFDYKGHKCVIVAVHFMPDLSHNGYVEVKEHERKPFYDDYDVPFMELTFQGQLQSFKELVDESPTFIGFDTNHYHDTVFTKSMDNVRAVCKRIVDEVLTAASAPVSIEHSELPS